MMALSSARRRRWQMVGLLLLRYRTLPTYGSKSYRIKSIKSIKV